MEFGLSPSQSQDPQTAWAAYSMRMKHKNLTQVGGWCGVGEWRGGSGLAFAGTMHSTYQCGRSWIGIVVKHTGPGHIQQC